MHKSSIRPQIRANGSAPSRAVASGLGTVLSGCCIVVGGGVTNVRREPLISQPYHLAAIITTPGLICNAGAGQLRQKPIKRPSQHTSCRRSASSPASASQSCPRPRALQSVRAERLRRRLLGGPTATAPPCPCPVPLCELQSPSSMAGALRCPSNRRAAHQSATFITHAIAHAGATSSTRCSGMNALSPPLTP